MAWQLPSMDASSIAAAVSAIGAVGAFWAAWVTLRLNITPAIVFVRGKEKKPWIVRNHGNGPAINVIVQGSKPDGSLSKAILYHSIAPRSGRENQTDGADILIAYYEDLAGKWHITKCRNNIHKHFHNVSYLRYKLLTWGWKLNKPDVAFESSEIVD